MFQKLDTTKAIQALAVLVRNEGGGKISKMRLLKMLYIADREAIKEIGSPILGSKAVAMDHGPLHSSVLDLIDGKHIDEPQFASVFTKSGYRVELSGTPGVGKLSRFEVDKLQEVSDRYASVGDWTLAHGITHKFPEYIQHFQPNTSTMIPLESIIDAVGRGDDKESIVRDARDKAIADRIFGV